MNLKTLIKGVEVERIYNDKNIFISSIHSDSREVKKNSLFVAIRGEKLDGNNYIKQAINLRAKVIIFEGTCDTNQVGIVFIKVKDTRQAVALVARNFYKNPSSKIKLIGITGTNGKTTIATSLFSITKALGYHSALISTIENKIDSKTFEAKNTTPDSISINKFLNNALQKKCKFVFMECSSHAVDQKRTYGLNFTGGVFTNLTRDHLDYHKTFKNYIEAKKGFFDQLPSESFALVNKDDKNSDVMLKNTKASKHYFSLDNKSEFVGKIVNQDLGGFNLAVNGEKIFSSFLGRYNAYNILGIYGVCLLLGLPKKKVIGCIAKLKPPAGRLEFHKSKNGVYGIVDYAHTPDALLNVLKTLDGVRGKQSKIITVVGCGGDRDKTKRPIMGEIATKFSDFVVFTSDNPRSEIPEIIINEITNNLKKNNYQKITDRKKAIKKAVKLAKKGDAVLIAGKGHENYQIFKNKTVHFSDMEELENNFKGTN